MSALITGDPVTVSWRGRMRYGVVTGAPYAGVGATFVPVHMDDDGQTCNVDTRIVYLGIHA